MAALVIEGAYVMLIYICIFNVGKITHVYGRTS